MTRVLSTSSRELTDDDEPAVEKALLEAVDGKPGPHTLVHGGARGGDTIFGRVAARLGWEVEVFPADWAAPCESSCNHGPRRQRVGYDEDYCPAAGHRRNARMVSTMKAALPDVAVVAVYKRGAANKGTSNCVRLAKGAGLDVKRVVV